MTQSWRLDLARRAIRTADRHTHEGRTDRAREAMAFAKKMLANEDVDDMAEAVRDGRVSEERLS